MDEGQRRTNIANAIENSIGQPTCSLILIMDDIIRQVQKLKSYKIRDSITIRGGDSGELGRSPKRSSSTTLQTL